MVAVGQRTRVFGDILGSLRALEGTPIQFLDIATRLSRLAGTAA